MPFQQQQTARPPEAPKMDRKLKLPLRQLVGVPLIALVPLLALAGVLGDSRSSASRTGEVLDLQVTYPTRIRYKRISPMEIRVKNVSSSPVDRVIVKLDEQYVSQFSNVEFTPSPHRVYEVELKDVHPGEQRTVAVELQAEKFWRHQGWITASAGSDNLTIDLQTFTFP